MPKNSEKETDAIKSQEKVLAVERKILFPDKAHYGLQRLDQKFLEKIIETIQANASFLPRSEIEENEEIKQIIPYLVFFYQDQVLLMKRRLAHTDARIASRFTLGIGGHIRESEFVGGDIFAWARREFEEEVSYQGNLTFLFLGLLNDETDAIGRVHTGLVLQLIGDSPKIGVRGEFETGQLVSLSEAEKYYKQMENWSQIVFRSLKGE